MVKRKARICARVRRGGKAQKAGTQNKKQAAKRDEAAAVAASRAAAAEPQSPVERELEDEPDTGPRRSDGTARRLSMKSH